MSPSESAADGTHRIEVGTTLADRRDIRGHQAGEVVDIDERGRVGVQWSRAYENMSTEMFVWKLRTGRLGVLNQ